MRVDQAGGSNAEAATRRVALVTGASRGIGRATALELARDGYDIVAMYHADDAAVAEGEIEVSQLGRRYLKYRVDVADEAQVQACFRSFLAQTGRALDVVVVSSGITADGYAATMSADRFDRVVNVNLRGAFLVCRAAIRAMRRTGGSIVLLSSTSGWSGQAGQANYSASKGGINAITQALAKETAALNIRVNAVAPGLTATDMLAQMHSGARAALLDLVPMKRPAEPVEIAKVIAFLASSGASYMTGQIVRVDGGLTA